MSFDLFRDDPNPPSSHATAAAAIGEGRRRRARRRAVVGTATSLVLVVVAALALSPDGTRRPVVADDSATPSPCRLDQLSISHTGSGAALGSWGDRLLFQNVGRDRCVLEGYANVTGLTDSGEVQADETQSGMIGHETKEGTGPVMLNQGDVAEAVVEGTNVPPGDATCRTISSLTIGVPLDDVTLQLLGSWNDCDGLEVHPFTPHGTATNECPTLDDDLPVTTIRRQHEIAGDGVNDRFAPPGDVTPLLSAQEARARLSPTALTPPTDAVLTQWTNLRTGTGTGPTRLIWLLRNMYVAVAPSMGEPTCAENAYFVDATTGDLMLQRSGHTALLPTRPTSSTTALAATATTLDNASTTTAPASQWVSHPGTASLTFSGVQSGQLADVSASCNPRPGAESSLDVHGTLNGTPWLLMVQSYTGEMGRTYQVITGKAGGGTGLEPPYYFAREEYPKTLTGVTDVDWAHGATLEIDLASEAGHTPAGTVHVSGAITCS